ncbi:MAG: hypothetical protein M3N98_02170, partial [Actinomycetota bacterium]|nr:hypothetical protein [Actinomycetota bacterium]
MIDAGQLWKSCSDQLRIQVSEAAWLSCFDAVTATALEGNSLVLAAPSPQVRERLEGRYRSMIESAVRECAGQPLDVQLEVQAPHPQPGGDHDSGAPSAPPAQAVAPLSTQRPDLAGSPK